MYEVKPLRSDPGRGVQAGRAAITRVSIGGRAPVTRRACLGLGAAAACGLTLAGPAAHAQAQPAGPSFFDSFAGMRLLDQDGQPMRLDALRGKVVLLNFIFTTCSTVCPVQTQALAQWQRQWAPALRTRLHLVSVSLDPLGDTPGTLKAFARRYQIAHDQWSFVTGRPEDIYRLAETLWLFRDGKGKAPLEEHATSLWLVDPHGALRLRLAGNPPSIPRLQKELGDLLQVADAQPLPPNKRLAASRGAQKPHQEPT